MAEPFLSIILPTIGKATLVRTLRSIKIQHGVSYELLLVSDGPSKVAKSLWEQFGFPGQYIEVPGGPSGDWGHTPRNLAMPRASGKWLMSIDDDDVYLDGVFAKISELLNKGPEIPHLFRMKRPPDLIWKGGGGLVEGNVSTQNIVTPNIPAKLGKWGSRYAGDFDFIRETVALHGGMAAWCDLITCLYREREQMLKLHFGCGANKMVGWENHDLDVDLAKPLPYPNESADFIFTEHVIEHLTTHQAWNFLEESYRILKRGGVIRTAFPDLERIDRLYDDPYLEHSFRRGWSEPTRKGVVKSIIFNFGHQSIWTLDTLRIVLVVIGFGRVSRTSVGASAHEDLRGIEWHHNSIGIHNNLVETSVIDALK